MKQAHQLLESGHHMHALKDVESAIKLLIQDSTQVIKKSNIVLCVNYKLALILLLRIRRADAAKERPDSVMESALLSTFLASVPIFMKHRVTCFRMAIARNMDASNFSIAARVINNLLPHMPPQAHGELEKRLKVCEERGYSDSPNLPAGAALEKVRFCWKSFRAIEPSSRFFQCNYCKALFLSDVAQEQDRCAYCMYGALEMGTTEQ